MTVWLHRQETVDCHALYLGWRGCQACKDSIIDEGEDEEPEGNQGEETDGERVEVEGADDGVEVTVETPQGESVAMIDTHHMRTALCKVPTNHPPHLRHIPARNIMTKQHATRFLECLQAYLISFNIGFTLHSFDTFNLYSRLVFKLPPILEVSDSKLKNIVRASPPRPRRLRSPAKPAHLDFVLVHCSDRNPSTEGTAIEGAQLGTL